MRKVKVSKKEMNEMGWTREQKLDYYCNLNNLVTLIGNNGKLGSQITGLSLPPVETCRPDSPCKKTCYACKGHQQFSSVLGTYYKNLRLYRENPTMFFEQIEAYLKYSGYRYFRWFDSGDCPDYQFINYMVELANKMPNVKFMAFTKRYHWFEKYLEEGYIIPKNLNIVFSAWNKDWKFTNKYGFPVAYVNFKNPSLNPNIPEDAKICDGHCSICFKCWHLKKRENVVFNQH